VERWYEIKRIIQVSTELKTNHTSHMINYGKPTTIACYVVRCPKCDSEKNVITINIIDGEEAAGTIQNPQVFLHGARCKKCLWEHYF